ncbi:MAG: hypothetical protein LBM98_04545 [Oscillospiraceae bacterium]|jgi:hypothetical protein|nr:hypothetical protein [Oscillospiraceae bacterium]
MTQEIILDTNTLPEELAKRINSTKVRVEQSISGLKLIPLTGDGHIPYTDEQRAKFHEAIKRIRGSAKDSTLTVESFLAEKHAAGEDW